MFTLTEKFHTAPAHTSRFETLPDAIKAAVETVKWENTHSCKLTATFDAETDAAVCQERFEVIEWTQGGHVDAARRGTDGRYTVTLELDGDYK